MFISSQEYDVLETPIKQTFNTCKEDSGATLYVRQRDVGAFIFLTFSKKYTEVRCNLTGKVIKKREWNNETKTAATELLKLHKVSKKGWYVFGLLIACVFGLLFYSIFSDIKSTELYEASFSTKTDNEKTAILEKLGEGDLIKTSNYVYKIASIDKNNVTLLKGGSVTAPFDPINESQTYKSEPVTIDANTFWQHHSINYNSELGWELIFQVLDK